MVNINLPVLRYGVLKCHIQLHLSNLSKKWQTVNIIEPNGDIRVENSPPARHISWKESQYYPTIDLSDSQPEVDRVRIEDDSFIPDPTEVHLDVEDRMLPDIEARTVHLDAEDMTLSDIEARTDSPPCCNLASNEVGDDSDGFMERQQFSSKEVNNCGMFEIRKYCHVYSCSHDVSKKDHHQAFAKLIAQNIQFKYDGSSSSYRAADIRQDFQQQYSYDISYHKAWRAKECAMQIVQGSSLRGFSSSIRPVIAVDGAFLKGKYKGTMFIATCKDGNNQIYPLAFCVGDSENDASWLWFCTKLRESNGEVENLVFIFYHYLSIKKFVSTVFPNATYGVCTYHLKQNLRAHFKDVDVGGIFEAASKAY
ncbi:hypothetical protein WN943_003510 [Citrus x changshan-huyou]